jgi:hypothetical protein
MNRFQENLDHFLAEPIQNCDLQLLTFSSSSSKHMGYNPKNISLRIYDLQIIGAKLVKPNVFEESLSHPFTNWWGMYWAWVYPKTCHPRFYQVLGSGAGRQH